MKFTATFHDYNGAISMIQHCTEMLCWKGCILSTSLSGQDKNFAELRYFVPFGFCVVLRVCIKFFTVIYRYKAVSTQVEKLCTIETGINFA